MARGTRPRPSTMTCACRTAAPAAPDRRGAHRRRRHPALPARRGGRRVPACGVRAHRLRRRRRAGPRPSMPRCGAMRRPCPRSPTRRGCRACCCACCTTCCTRRCPAGMRLADVPPQSPAGGAGVPPARRGSWTRRALGAVLRQQGYDVPRAGLRHAVGLSARLHRPGVRARRALLHPRLEVQPPGRDAGRLRAGRAGARDGRAGLSPAGAAVRAGAAPPAAATAAGLRPRRGTSAACCYLFVRGVRPALAAPDGRATGVFAHRPTLATLQRLSDLLDGVRETA